MRARRKPLIFNVWHNSTGKRPDDGPPEPMPPWIRSVAEKAAKPGTSFLVQNLHDRPLCPAESILVQGQDGRVYPVGLDTFKIEYDLINVAAPAKPEGEKK